MQSFGWLTACSQAAARSGIRAFGPVPLTFLGAPGPVRSGLGRPVRAGSRRGHRHSVVLDGSEGGVLWHGVAQFVVLAGGGALAGGVTAAVVMVVRSRITDPVLESVVALITPYVAYVLVTALHVSGVTAVIVAGLIVGTQRARITTAATPAAGARGLPDGDLPAGERGVQPHRPGTADAGQRSRPCRAVDAGRARGRRHPDRHPRPVGVPVVGRQAVAAGPAPSVLGGPGRSLLGWDPGGRAAGRSLVDPADHQQRSAADAT